MDIQRARDMLSGTAHQNLRAIMVIPLVGRVTGTLRKFCGDEYGIAEGGICITVEPHNVDSIKIKKEAIEITLKTTLRRYERG